MKIHFCLLILVMCVAVVHADEIPWYIGGSVGQTDLDTGVSNLTGGTSLDEKDTGYKFYLGADITENIALEVGYIDFGEATMTGDSGDGFTYAGTAYTFNQNQSVLEFDGDAFVFSALGKWEVHENIVPFGRIGVHIWDVSAEISNTTTSGSASDDGTDFFYGGGIDFPLNTSLTIRTEYEHYLLDSDDLGFLSVGLIYHIP